MDNELVLEKEGREIHRCIHLAQKSVLKNNHKDKSYLFYNKKKSTHIIQIQANFLSIKDPLMLLEHVINALMLINM